MPKREDRRFQAHEPEPEPGPAYYVVAGVLIALGVWVALVFVIPFAQSGLQPIAHP